MGVGLATKEKKAEKMWGESSNWRNTKRFFNKMKVKSEEGNQIKALRKNSFGNSTTPQSVLTVTYHQGKRRGAPKVGSTERALLAMKKRIRGQQI